MDKLKTLPTRLIAASATGTILEWYDFSLFAFLTPFFAKSFFPQGNALVALMSTYAIFAVGYFVRPIGAIFFGHMGDRFGRKKPLVWSILLMSLPTFLMGLLPTYQSIGIWAPVLLISLRICQGLSAGGESTGAVLFVLESVAAKQRGFMGALMWAMIAVGMLLGSLAATLVQHSQLEWAWRIPCLLGILTGILGYFLRRYTAESMLFAEAMKEKKLVKFPLWESIKQFKREISIIIGLYSLSAMITYLVFIFMPGYASNVLGMPKEQTSLISTLAYLCITLLAPLGGYASDRLGKTTCLYWGAAGFALLSYPLFYFISQNGLLGLIFAEIFFLVFAALFQGTLSAAAFELIPTYVRYSVIAVGYNVSYSLFGGTAPFVASYLVNVTGNPVAPGLYLATGALIALIAITVARRQFSCISPQSNLGSSYYRV